MIEPQPHTNGRIHADLPDLATLLQNPDFRAWRAQTLARIAELQQDGGRAAKALTDSWLHEDAAEQRETLHALLAALGEDNDDQKQVFE